MLILDNSVLSALTNIGILDLLKKLNQEVFISPDVAQEYSKRNEFHEVYVRSH